MKYTTKKFGAKSCHEDIYENGVRVFYSYATPVCAYVPGRGPLCTVDKYSRTTSKHVTMWCRNEATPEMTNERELIALRGLCDDASMWA